MGGRKGSEGTNMPEKVRQQRGGTAEKHISWTFPLKMFSRTKGTGERRPRVITPTSSELQNGLQAQRDTAQHLDGPQADIHHITSTCGPNGSVWRGWRRLTGVPLGNGLQHNRVSVNSSLTECSFVAHQQQTEPHLSSRKCVQDTPAQVRGHGNCGSPVCVAEQQSCSVREVLLKEPNTSDWTETNERGFTAHNSTLHGTSNGYTGRNLNGPDLMRKVMLSTKDPNISHQQTSCQADLNRPGIKSQRAIQDQIQNVVLNLEEVLHGLKEIHLEMKEVVRQIDLLTVDIDMNEEDPGGASKMELVVRESESSRSAHEVDNCKTPTGVSMLCSSTNSCNSSTNPPPAHPIRDQTQQLGSTQEMINSQKHESRTGPRGQKPPPYPYTNTPGRVNTKAKVQKAPPYPFRRTLLSTIV